LRDYLLSEDDTTYEGDIPHPPMFYQGTLESPDQARGAWEVRDGNIQLPGGRGLWFPEPKGIWSIEFESI